MAEDKHETRIVVNGDASIAVRSLGQVKSALGGVSRGIALISTALGKINWAVHGITMLVQAFNWVKDKITETARVAAKFRWGMEMRFAANETARLVGFHEKLAKIMRDELDTLQKLRVLENIKEQGKKDYEDGRRQADRARQLFEAKTPEEEQSLRERFADEDERLARSERKARRKSEIEWLDAEESVYSSKASMLKDNNAEIDKQLKSENWNLVRANGKEEYAEPIKKRIEALEQRKKANEAEIAQFEKEARFRRDQIAALKQPKDYEGPTAGEWNRKAETKKRQQQEADEKAKREQKLEDARHVREKEEALAALDPSAADYEDRKREVERAYEVKAAERKVSRAENAEDKAAAEEELKAVNIRQEREQDEERQRPAGDWAGKLAAVDDAGHPKDRLAAMGLGSGGGADRTAQEQAKDVKTLVGLAKEQIQATRENNRGSTAVYAP